jgi:transaldolase
MGVIDVSASSAHDTQATIAEAERLAGAISRPNAS